MCYLLNLLITVTELGPLVRGELISNLFKDALRIHSQPKV